MSCFVTQRDPFTLYFDGEDKLYGRGTTDCLGHVAMLTFVFKALAERKPPLSRSVVALFISGEEGGETGVGIDLVVKVELLLFATFCPMFYSSLDVAYLVF
jgi:acetylornithine deacetylase/succinyl-diaminopimelate desuccinylase-like protein